MSFLHVKNFERFSGSRFYPFILAFGAFALMIFGLLPCEVILVPAILSAPHRWKHFIVAAAVGSAIGAAVLASFIFYFGLPLIHHFFPALEMSKSWLIAFDWISHFGAAALIVIAIIPIAQTPAIAIAGLFQLSFTTVLVSFLVGKCIKYTMVARLTIETRFRLKKSKLFKRKRRRGETLPADGLKPIHKRIAKQ